MKTPTQWLDQFTAQEGAYDRPTAEANIKAIQDEAFKAGMHEAAAIATDWQSAEAACRAILKAHDKLP